MTGSAEDAAILLWDVASGTQSAAGCDHNGCDLTWHDPRLDV